MNKHTLGKWIIDGDIIGVNSNGLHRIIVGLQWNDEQGKADALLIAAAPDMLEALKQTVCALECCGKDYSATENARRAILKATEGDPNSYSSGKKSDAIQELIEAAEEVKADAATLGMEIPRLHTAIERAKVYQP